MLVGLDKEWKRRMRLTVCTPFQIASQGLLHTSDLIYPRLQLQYSPVSNRIQMRMLALSSHRVAILMPMRSSVAGTVGPARRVPIELAQDYLMVKAETA